uniref:Uncharacterized protein n=1 Tax=Romanomermis culicivorax TaxID=13658 RepID=A0A915JS91_ROMCU
MSTGDCCLPLAPGANLTRPPEIIGNFLTSILLIIASISTLIIIIGVFDAIFGEAAATERHSGTNICGLIMSYNGLRCEKNYESDRSIMTSKNIVDRYSPDTRCRSNNHISKKRLN